MIEIKTIGVWGFEGSLRGCRMPYESFDKDDSFHEKNGNWHFGQKNMELAKKLIKGGSEHRKFMRMIHVQAEVRAPRYWWAEMDKYKWVEANSSSTMHLITKRELKVSDFSTSLYSTLTLETIIGFINKMIDRHNYEEDKETKDELFIAIKQLLPDSYNQLRMIDTNYECLLSIYHQRRNHRLTEWSGPNGFCEWVESLPYMKEFINACS